MMPRWWMAADYEPLLRDENGLAWEIRNARVKTLTEEDLFVDGQRQRSGRSHPLTQKWAEIFTSKYEELSAHDTVFRDLRNCMDLAVLSALLMRERLEEKAGLSLAALRDDELSEGEFAAPKSVETIATAREKRSGWEVTASGGVDIDPWAVARNQAVDTALAATREQAVTKAPAHWWWD
jgi:hypothetical protein